jgi:hypothetical protein
MSWIIAGGAVLIFGALAWLRRGSDLAFGFDYGRSGLVLMGAFCVLLELGSGPVAAAVAGACLAGGTFLGYRTAVSRVGVEALVFAKATSLAFFVTIVSAAVYGIFEMLADAPKVSMIHVWSLGVVVWVAATAVFTRQHT